MASLPGCQGERVPDRVAFWALVLIVPLALVIANLLAVFPGQRAARLPLNQILRAE